MKNLFKQLGLDSNTKSLISILNDLKISHGTAKSNQTWYIWTYTKINWLKHFFLIKRSFSVKIGNNLKILFDLVINIIDSDDFV